MSTESKEAKVNSRRIWGWIVAIVGGLCTMWSIFWAVYAVYSYLTLDPLYYDIVFKKDLITSMGVILSTPGVVIGIPLLILGIRLIRKGKTPTTKLGGLDNPQEEVKR
jgi:hypothetical protein